MGEPSLEARIRRLEDRAEIIELTYRYAVAVDDRDFAVIEAIFAPDGIFDTPGGRSVGGKAVADFYRKRLPDFGASIHTPNGHILDLLDEDHATGVVLSHAEIAIDGDAYWLGFRYDDRYVRHDGAWKFHERQVRTVYTMPLADLPKGLAEPDRKRWPHVPRGLADLPEPLATYQASLG
ncbi:MAG: nuclear transport factor 2 family protein [Acidimicrobiia bacterium]